MTEAPPTPAERRAAPRRGAGLRLRITLAFLGTALVVSTLVAATTYVLAERYLLSSRVEDAVEQSLSNMRVAVDHLAETETPPDGVDPEEWEQQRLGDLVDRLERVEVMEVLVLSPGLRISSSFEIGTRFVPTSLKETVSDGRVGYVIADGPPRRLVFGSPVPNRPLQAYFFFALGDLDQTLAILGRVLVFVAIGAVALATLLGSRVSRRVAVPVRRASRAARQVAEGHLHTRLRVDGRDELAALAASFNEMAAALEQRISRERRFVGDVSHELRTPLTTLRASSDYLLENADDLPAGLRRAVELLAADLEYLQRLVDDLLDLSRVEAGRVDMAWERVNVGDLTREVVARRTRAGANLVRIEAEQDPDALTTVADKQRLERVVGNLVDNALSHGLGTEVTVRVGSEDGSILLSVEDRGPGVPPQAAPRIFERFFKADPARHRGEGSGSGLGLAIARENAHLHGGEIRAFNGRDGGAKFEVVLPRREQEPDE